VPWALSRSVSIRPRGAEVGIRNRGIGPVRPSSALSNGRVAPKPGKLALNERLHDEVQTQLKDQHSPEQIARRLVLDFPMMRRSADIPS
jgi:IS30 family transposase